jgi:hypothetical protein
MVLRTQKEIKREKRLLYEVSMSANNYRIVTGLSVARGMIPSIKLINTLLDVSVSNQNFRVLTAKGRIT